MTVEDWAEIRRLHRVEGMAIKAIARQLGVSRNAVRRALARDAPPTYERAPRGSIEPPRVQWRLGSLVSRVVDVGF